MKSHCKPWILITLGVENHFYHSRTTLKFGVFWDWNVRLILHCVLLHLTWLVPMASLRTTITIWRPSKDCMDNSLGPMEQHFGPSEFRLWPLGDYLWTTQLLEHTAAQFMLPSKTQSSSLKSNIFLIILKVLPRPECSTEEKEKTRSNTGREPFWTFHRKFEVEMW